MNYVVVDFARQGSPVQWIGGRISTLVRSTEAIVMIVAIVVALGLIAINGVTIVLKNNEVANLQAQNNVLQTRVTQINSRITLVNNEIQRLASYERNRYALGSVARQISNWIARYPSNTDIEVLTIQPDGQSITVSGHAGSRALVTQAFRTIGADDSLATTRGDRGGVKYDFLPGSRAGTTTPAPAAIGSPRPIAPAAGGLLNGATLP